MGDGGRWAMGDGRWAMGDGRWAMGDGREEGEGKGDGAQTTNSRYAGGAHGAVTAYRRNVCLRGATQHPGVTSRGRARDGWRAMGDGGERREGKGDGAQTTNRRYAGGAHGAVTACRRNVRLRGATQRPGVTSRGGAKWDVRRVARDGRWGREERGEGRRRADDEPSIRRWRTWCGDCVPTERPPARRNAASGGDEQGWGAGATGGGRWAMGDGRGEGGREMREEDSPVPAAAAGSSSNLD
ncbi:hypothetical protein EI94DRAFT_1709933 [Lactarius quietus]|nr:hypothetical protein EI94DRAFT_1709933 [Lactarius quietus]